VSFVVQPFLQERKNSHHQVARKRPSGLLNNSPDFHRCNEALEVSMTTELLEWVNQYLANDEEIIVPIKKMWIEWRADHEEPSLEEFTVAVLADPRNEEMPGVDHAEGLEEMSPEEQEEYEKTMEEMGFFSGPRVKLKSREITREHLARMIFKHNERLEQALRAAYEAMPQETEEQQEGELIDLIEKVREFRQTLREMGLEQSDDEQP
jgi:hypothetical protein